MASVAGRTRVRVGVAAVVILVVSSAAGLIIYVEIVLLLPPSMGIIHHLSCPHTNEQIGLVERRCRHVVETGLTLLAQSGVPNTYCHFAFDTTVYRINRMPYHTTSHVSPFETIFNRKPDLSFLKVFGCQCFPHLGPYNQHKMDLRSISWNFLGYSSSHHGYQCLDLTTDNIYIYRHVWFHKTSFPLLQPKFVPLQTTSHDPYVSTY